MVENLIESLGDEVNTREKESHSNGRPSAIVVHRNFHKFKENNVVQTTNFKKKKNNKGKKRTRIGVLCAMNPTIGLLSVRCTKEGSHTEFKVFQSNH